MIRKILSAWAEKLVPSKPRPRLDSRHELNYQASMLDVDTLHGILEEAWSGNTQRLFAVYRDLVLGNAHGQAELNTRKLAVVGEHPTFQPYEKGNALDTQANALVSTIWDAYPGGREAVTHLLDSCLWPVSIVEKTFKPSAKPGVRYEIKELRPVPYHLLDYTEGRLRIRDVATNGMPLGTFHEPDPARYIVHRGHLMTSIPDNFGGPMRAALFWWLFATMDRDWWIRFLERFGAPFIVGKYDDGDDGARSLLRSAFSSAARLFGLVVSQNTEIEVHSVNGAQHGDAFEQFHDTAKRELSKLILGQTMTSEAQAGGIGGNQAQVHDGVRGDIKKFDALVLGETLRHQLFTQLLALNGLGAARAPSVAWGADSADSKALAETIASLFGAGLRPTLEALEDISLDLGFPIERVVASPAGPLALDAFASIPGRLSGSDVVDMMAGDVARGIAAANRRALRDALAKAGSLDEFAAMVQLPTEADLAARFLVTASANALGR